MTNNLIGLLEDDRLRLSQGIFYVIYEQVGDYIEDMSARDKELIDEHMMRNRIDFNIIVNVILMVEDVY